MYASMSYKKEEHPSIVQ